MIELIVMCHNAVSDIVHRHIPNWKKAGFDKISFVSPRDDAFIIENYDCYNIGEAGNVKISSGAKSVDRYLFCLTLAATKNICSVFEYDVVCWKEFLQVGIPKHGTLASGKIHIDNSNRFTSNWFTHTQYLGLGSTYRLILPYISSISKKEEYIGDRIIAQAMNLAGVRVEERSKFSTNTYNDIDLEKAIKLKMEGKLYITHGIKSQEAFNRLNCYTK